MNNNGKELNKFQACLFTHMINVYQKNNIELSTSMIKVKQKVEDFYNNTK